MPKAQRTNSRGDYCRSIYNHRVLLNRSTQSLWFFKKHNPNFATPSFIHDDQELETASASIWRWLIGTRAPQNRCLYDNNGSLSGLASEGIVDYKGARELSTQRNLYFSTHKLLEYDIASILTASFLLEEIDLHRDNWGFSPTLKQFVKIDHGRSHWSIRRPFIDGFEIYNKNRFIIHSDDILSFPNLRYTTYHFWPANMGFSRDHSDLSLSEKYLHQNISQLESMRTFIEQKYYIMTKFLLLPKRLMIEVANQNLSSKICRNIFIANHVDKQVKLTDALAATSASADSLADDNCPADYLTYLKHNQSILVERLEQDYADFMLSNKTFETIPLKYDVKILLNDLIAHMELSVTMPVDSEHRLG